MKRKSKHSLPSMEAIFNHRSGGLKARWYQNTLSFVLAIVVATVVIVSILIASYYYSTLRSGLETKAETRFLHPGEVGTFNKRNGRLQIEKGDIELAVSWASNQIVFKNRPLNEICPLLSKWYNVKINLSPELQEQYRYTFTLRHEPLEEIMRIMSRIHPINYEFNDENMLTILPKQKQ